MISIKFIATNKSTNSFSLDDSLNEKIINVVDDKSIFGHLLVGIVLLF